MLQEATSAPSSAPEIRPSDNPADRRAHPRIPSSKLRVDRVRIPHRPSVSLVDLSSGGALLELPFQAQPDTRFGVELHTAVERVEVPFQLLRCYVAELKGGVTYHAAGAFDTLLNLQALAARASTALQRLIGTLERLLRGGQKTAAERSAGEFNEILAEVLIGLRRGESFDLVVLKMKARLTQTYPSMSILPTMSTQRDKLTTVESFGLTFKSRYAFSAHDRRFLKASAQLISMLESCRSEMREETEEPSSPTQIIYTPAEWLASHSQPPRGSDRPRAARLRRAPLPFGAGSPVFSAG
jgi:hypothetical protein